MIDYLTEHRLTDYRIDTDFFLHLPSQRLLPELCTLKKYFNTFRLAFFFLPAEAREYIKEARDLVSKLLSFDAGLLHYTKTELKF